MGDARAGTGDGGAEAGAGEHTSRGRFTLLPFPGAPDAAPERPTPEQRREKVDALLAQVRKEWGQASITRLGDVRELREAAARPTPPARPAREKLLPPWWPGGMPGGALPRTLEVVAGPGTGRLTLALCWLAAAHPTLAAVVDPDGTFYPPAASAAGLDLSQLVLVRPPANAPRTALDAVAILLRSEAFDAIVCPLPPRARVSVTFAAHLAAAAATAGTCLLLLEEPDRYRSGALGGHADYRVRIEAGRREWRHGQLLGLRLRTVTERARADGSGAGDLGLVHELHFRFGSQLYPSPYRLIGSALVRESAVDQPAERRATGTAGPGYVE